MSRRNILVKVRGKKAPTDRSSISEGRLNFKLKFEGKVDDSSYVFTGSKVSKLQAYSELMRNVEGAIESILRSNIDEYKFIKIIGESLKDKYVGTSQYKISGKYGIPGSAIKGSVRANLEFRFKPFQIGADYYSYSCYIVEDEIFQGSFAVRHVDLWGEEVSFMREHCGIDAVCILCDMFGTSGLSSRTHFSDAIMVSGNVHNISGGWEVINSGSKFNFDVIAMNYNYAELGLLLLGFNIFGKIESEEPLLLGKWKYRYSKIGESFHGKYFGMMRFKLIDAESYDLKELKKEELSQLVLKAKDALMKEEFAKHLDFSKHLGV
ncbi:MAG: RAMP superfamily CRISPR-associated protein [Thermoprotei archaeon]|jgi:CRISPR/Cas system CSM-associated protein Csm3 (group 7 of RAMP superfamily)